MPSQLPDVLLVTMLVLLFGLSIMSTSAGSHAHSPKPSNPFDALNQLLADAVNTRVTPGMTAAVVDSTGVLWQTAYGSFTYGDPPPFDPSNRPMTLDTRFDLASLTKVVGATSAIAQFYQRGELSLDTRVGDILGPAYNVNNKTDITVLNCLLHNAGYPPDPYPLYSSAEFGCPETAFSRPNLTFSCQNKVYEALLNQTLINPIGSTYLYSDLSFITLMYVVGNLARTHGYVTTGQLVPGCYQSIPASDQCFFEAYVRLYVLEPLQMSSTGFLPPPSVYPDCAPTYYQEYRGVIAQGTVSDSNAYAMGGIAGHAGIFSNTPDLIKFMHTIMFNQSNLLYNSTTYELFTTEFNHAQSSRALGWNTNDPDVVDRGWGLSCGTLSASTWMHIGYTGTEVCGDPDRQLFTVLLTNAKYPSMNNTQAHKLRVDFNTKVAEIYDLMSKGR